MYTFLMRKKSGSASIFSLHSHHALLGLPQEEVMAGPACPSTFHWPVNLSMRRTAIAEVLILSCLLSGKWR